eukprot:TRINITY_DN6958_c0_g1_i2.p1 TRINITY_DN6958_c0_g1~~TRINITY_DN6958_c0_g1_i2.p1  ORF type:complete len:138 (+),score=14.86 TRINITY_DN6958_c0_g1_i2:473-886(+)
MNFANIEVEKAFRLVAPLLKPTGSKTRFHFMTQFADWFSDCNEHLGYYTPEVVYFLAYGALMLNTDMHSEIIKVKMTQIQFLSYLEDLSVDIIRIPRPKLIALYDGIKEKPLFPSTSTKPEKSYWSQFLNVFRTKPK